MIQEHTMRTSIITGKPRASGDDPQEAQEHAGDLL